MMINRSLWSVSYRKASKEETNRRAQRKRTELSCLELLHWSQKQLEERQEKKLGKN